MKHVTVVKEKLGKRYLQAGVVATTALLPVVSNAAEGSYLPDAAELKTMLDGIGLAPLIAAAVLFMLGIAVGIFGGRKIVGFFSGR